MYRKLASYRNPVFRSGADEDLQRHDRRRWRRAAAARRATAEEVQVGQEKKSTVALSTEIKSSDNTHTSDEAIRLCLCFVSRRCV